jgi:hypothetical protein
VAVLLANNPDLYVAAEIPKWAALAHQAGVKPESRCKLLQSSEW